MNTQNLSDHLAAEIERHATKGQPVNTRESHDLASLSPRTLLPRAAVVKMLSTGELRAENPVHRNEPGGRYTFLSNELNDIRRAALKAIVERTVEEGSDDPTTVAFATGEALRAHVDSFKRKPGEVTEFAAFPPGLVQLDRYVRQEDDEPSTVSKIAKAGAVLAGGAALVGGASYLRGRLAAGPTRAGSLGVARTALLGLRKFRGDATAGVAAIKSAFTPAPAAITPAIAPDLPKARPGAARVAAVLAGRRPE